MELHKMYIIELWEGWVYSEKQYHNMWIKIHVFTHVYTQIACRVVAMCVKYFSVY